MQDYATIIFSNGFLSDYADLLQNEDFIRISSAYIPESFNWRLFGLGEALIVAGVFFLEWPVKSFLALIIQKDV